MRELGIVLEESVVGGMGFVEGQPGLEKGRVKATGVYNCKYNSHSAHLSCRFRGGYASVSHSGHGG